ncbi:MAG: LPS export ABC transporter periplasmic protein LptC [Bacteroidota bacterium]
MTLHKEHIISYIVTVFAVTLFLGCKNNFKEVQQIGVLQNAPVGEAYNIDLKYTDSARVIANLISPKMLDYSNRSFGFSEFPEGIELTIFDDDNNESKIFSDYAIYYGQTNLIDLRGNVILATHQKDTLFTDQMYYDEKKEWVFTNHRFRLKSPDRDIKGRGFDSDKDFKEYSMLEWGGDFDMDN